MKTIVFWQLPIKTASEGNSSENRFVKGKRHKKQKERVTKEFLVTKTKISLPCIVILTRVSPRQLDEHDNLRMSLKWVADAVAENIIPGKAAGRADDSKEITWNYKQEKGKPQSVKIEIHS